MRITPIVAIRTLGRIRPNPTHLSVPSTMLSVFSRNPVEDESCSLPCLLMLAELRDRFAIPMPPVAVARLHGAIGSGLDPARYERFFPALSRLPTTRGVVLEWDSPGGGVTASEELRTAVERLAETRPVVSHIAGTA